MTATDAAGNAATASVEITLDVVPPQIEILSPLPDEKLNIAKLGSSGNVQVAWSAKDGDPSLSMAREVVPGVSKASIAQSSFFSPTQPSDNGSTYQANIEVTDRAGNLATASVTFYVDRVPPTPVFQPASGERLTPRSVTASFSENVTPASAMVPVLQLSPAPPTAPTRSGNQWSVSGLDYDTAYTATVPWGAVVDSFGNPSAGPFTAVVHTEPAVPQSGKIAGFMPGHPPRPFAVAADQDGNVTFAVYSVELLFWRRFDQKTGQQVDINGWNFIPERVQVTAYRELDSFAVKRTYGIAFAGAAVLGNGTYEHQERVSYLTPGGTLVDQPGLAVLPVRASYAEGSGRGEVGLIVRDSSGNPVYRRAGGADVPVGVSPTHVLVRSPELWELIRFDETIGLGRQLRNCNSVFCAFDPPGGHAPFTSGGPEFAEDPDWSFAVAGDLRIYVYTDHIGSRTMYCASHWMQNYHRDPPALYTKDDLRVAPMNDKPRLLGAYRTPSGIEVAELDVSQGCSNSWQPITVVPGTSSAGAFEPIMFGNHPGLFFMNGSELHIYVH